MIPEGERFGERAFSADPATPRDRVKGNQVRILSDPVTVNGEDFRKSHCA